MPLLFALTLFVSATLLFLVQPMIGKMVLPLLGGSPAVWNTCMVFFQAALLFGYLYAHAVTKRLPTRRQVVLHLIVLLIPLVPLLLVGFDAAALAEKWLPPPTEANPIPWLLGLLGLAAGLPFFVVATSAPLLQRWFAGTGHSAGKDPYYLYAASNLGSMIALFSYPAVVEPYFGLKTQGWLWIAGYAGFVVMTALCAVQVWRIHNARQAWQRDVAIVAHNDDRPSLLRRLRWVALAAVPSSLMLGVTTYVTTDIAAIPLLWIIPLAIYLLTFILVFARLPLLGEQLLSFVLLTAGIVGLAYLVPDLIILPGDVVRGESIRYGLYLLVVPGLLLFLPWMRLPLHRTMLLALPVVIFVLTAKLPDLDLNRWLDNWQRIALQYTALFVAAMVCHGELARTRPTPAHLTEFYLCMSLGGVLGGLFNAMVAPVVFDRVVEYPLVIALACLLLPGLGLTTAIRPVRWLGVGVTAAIALFGLYAGAFFLGQTYLTVQEAETYDTPWRQIALWTTRPEATEPPLYRHRGFFGVVRVIEVRGDATDYHHLVHGTTDHGVQCYEPASRRGEPLSYFHREGPVGQLFRAVKAKRPKQHLAVLGVGTGCLAAYADPGWELTLFEIDPAIISMARDQRLFTFLDDCERRGVPVHLQLGDGRLQLAKAMDASFDVLFMDAFTSDAVPVHLLTREAVQLYFRKLKSDGVLVVNIANRYLKLEPVLANLAADLGLTAKIAHDDYDYARDKYATSWVVFARQEQDLNGLAASIKDDGATPWFADLKARKELGVWTDDYSNLLRILRLGEASE